MTTTLDAPPQRPTGIGGMAIGSLAAVWIIWGSTYLAIKIGLETLSPFVMQCARFIVASSVLAVVAVRSGSPRPTRVQVRNAAMIGLFLLIGGLGMVTLAEKRGVGTGLVATLIAVQPMLTALWAGIWGTWPGRREWIGMLVGVAGVGVLVSDGGLQATGAGLALMCVACCSWSFGSALSRRVDLPVGAWVSAVEMGAAAVAFALLALVRGEHVGVPSLRSGLALGYLMLFGSVIAFSAFTWLLGHVKTSLALTYAFVNPVIAVALGALVEDERLSVHLVIALPIILVGVALVTRAGRTPTPAALSD
jgi:drug/metabolite transporter (DMT)-like permease